MWAPLSFSAPQPGAARAVFEGMFGERWMVLALFVDVGLGVYLADSVSRRVPTLSHAAACDEARDVAVIQQYGRVMRAWSPYLTKLDAQAQALDELAERADQASFEARDEYEHKAVAEMLERWRSQTSALERRRRTAYEAMERANREVTAEATIYMLTKGCL